MRLAGKRQRRRPSQLASVVGSSTLLHVNDSQRNTTFLVDSGAQVSVVPHQSSAKPRSFLTAADGRQIPAWGCVFLPVVLEGRDHGLQRFVRAAVQQPLLGADFFIRTGLLIDVKHRRLVPASSPILPPAVNISSKPASSPPPSQRQISVRDDWL